MIRKIQLFAAALAVLLWCGIGFAQEPVKDIDPKRHVNLAAAQSHVVEANQEIYKAQQINDYDMKGHAEKARQLLVQVNQELKAAAEAANAAASAKNKK